MQVGVVILDMEKLKQDTTHTKLMKYQASLLQPCAHNFNMWRNPKRDRLAVPSYCCYAMIGQSLYRGGVQPTVKSIQTTALNNTIHSL